MVEVKVPILPESVSQADLVSWFKKEGDTIARGDNLVDIETDKVMIDIPSPVDGVLKKIVRPSGSSVQSGDIVAIIESSSAREAGASSPKVKDDDILSVKKDSTADPKNAAPSPIKPEIKNEKSLDKEARLLMPSAKKIAAENDINIKNIEGSGRGGRITKEDMIVVTSSKTVSHTETVAHKAPFSEETSPARSDKRVPMTRLRAKIAERLLESQATCAILTTFNEVNMQPVMDIRKKYGEEFMKQHGIKLGFMSFFVTAVIQALKKFPIINASIDGNDIVYHNYYDIGIAVGSPRGLVLPIIRDADQKSMAHIEKEISEFGQRAQTGKLTVGEMTGGTFSISNGGAFGSLMSTPIINPPQAAILGIHGVKQRPIAENGQVVIRPMNYLALSYDHRLIDGRDAVLFLVTIKDYLEDPVRALISL